MKTKREAYAQKMAEARHHARLENHGLKPVTVFVLPDDRGAIETAVDQINRRRGYLNSVFDPTSRAPLIRSTPEADEYGITASEAHLRERLTALIEKLERRARRKFFDAAACKPKEEYPRRLIEHGAVCYFNVVQELKMILGLPAMADRPEPQPCHWNGTLLRQPELPKDLGLEDLAQGGEGPGR